MVHFTTFIINNLVLLNAARKQLVGHTLSQESYYNVHGNSMDRSLKNMVKTQQSFCAAFTLYSVLHKYIKYTSRVDKLLRILNDSKLVGCQKKFQDERVTYLLPAVVDRTE